VEGEFGGLSTFETCFLASRRTWLQQPSEIIAARAHGWQKQRWKYVPHAIDVTSLLARSFLRRGLVFLADFLRAGHWLCGCKVGKW
jgi:hypothetical protein